MLTKSRSGEEISGQALSPNRCQRDVVERSRVLIQNYASMEIRPSLNDVRAVSITSSVAEWFLYGGALPSPWQCLGVRRSVSASDVKLQIILAYVRHHAAPFLSTRIKPTRSSSWAPIFVQLSTNSHSSGLAG